MKPTSAANANVTTIAGHIEKPHSVVSSPSRRPVVPVMTPAERSNSPPIISSATATAMIPSVDATSVQLAIPLSVPNESVLSQKKAQMTSAPSSEPTSGRRSSRTHRLMFASRSSATGSGVGGAPAGAAAAELPPPMASVITFSLRVLWTLPSCSVDPLVSSPRSLLRQLRDRVGVVLGDVAWAGEHGLAAADRVRVGLVQRQEDHRQVALQVLLLVDGELDLARLDRLHDVAAEIERGDLGVRAGALDRVARGDRDVRVEREDCVDRLVRLQLGLDLGQRGLDVVDALDLDVLDRAEALLGAVAALVEADVRLLVDDAEQLLRARLLELLPGALAGDRLGLADVGDRAELLVVLGAGVQRDDRDARGGRLLQRVADRVGVRCGDRDPVDLLGHRGVDQLRLLLRVVGGLRVLHRDAHLLAGVLRALLRDGPERVAAAVRDHGDRDVLALGQVDVVLTGGRSAPVVVVVATAGGREQGQPEHHRKRQQAGAQSCHLTTLSLRGAVLARNSMLACTSSTGPLPTGGSSPVIAASCSSTSQRSYPWASSWSSTSAMLASPRPRGRNRPACVAPISVSSPARYRAATSPSTSLRCTWVTRSPWSRAKATGSQPPIRRCPVSMHQPTSEAASSRATSPALSTSVPAWGCSANVMPWPATSAAISARCSTSRPKAGSSSGAGADQSASITAAPTKTSAPAAATVVAIASALRRAWSRDGSCSTSGTNAPTGASPWRSSS